MLSNAEKLACLKAARLTIRLEGPLQDVPVAGIPTISASCFVTLTRNGTLRGCIGTLWPYRPLAEDIQSNAYAAAFADPRFAPITPAEEPQITIEISLLTLPQPWNGTADELLAWQSKEPHGIILNYHGRQATFLPQVWEQISGERFFRELSRKADCPFDAWKQKEAKLWTYQVESFSERP
ncbi:MAG: AmmeMemoRadiSam system protein A [Spirochaetales bacterium]|nr:AmmeMemoRadiSam system protein A [Spirochaetales bacterium]